MQGECEEVLVRLTDTPREQWRGIAGLCLRQGDEVVVQGGPQAADMMRLPVLRWPPEALRGHAHHHHRFDSAPDGPGAEMEVSRGCPYHCTFCAKENFRDRYRRRPLATILDELDGLIAASATYVYFIDEIFLPWRELLEEGHIEVTGAPELHGLFFNSRVSRRDHVALYVVRDFRMAPAPVAGLEIVSRGFFPPDALPGDTTPATRARIRELLAGAPKTETW